ncbi:hypothetical protein K8352_19110, partial [Flavobacteriaceae bacterium F89]
MITKKENSFQYLLPHYLIISLLLVVGILPNDLLGQSTNDYRSNGSGSWTNISSWQVFNGSTWVSASSYPGQNPGTKAVSIGNGNSITLSSNISNNFDSLTIGDGTGATDGLLISSNSFLNTMLVTIANGGSMKWTSNNTDLTLPSAVNFIIESGGVLDKSAPCNATKTLTIGASKYASCNGGGSGSPQSFQNVIDNGGVYTYDYYEGAIDVTGFINSCSPDAAYDTRGATPDKNAGSNWNNSGPKYNRWFKFTAPATGQ